ncbi:hypothetical protein HELRODRAFT_166667 [Helobdella robusta]|uniref:Uncharacterized protein n=1 Tax=Helobdella robusta TaxID=6412 RepID=T1EYC0_HELRO|nr:hypothetical protein HELRODRAFT_166667 [Helobdella robusta]ESO11653.1 hypothetical protein HELRODRAFT_166667 [Helobdella robusta]
MSTTTEDWLISNNFDVPQILPAPTTIPTLDHRPEETANNGIDRPKSLRSSRKYFVTTPLLPTTPIPPTQEPPKKRYEDVTLEDSIAKIISNFVQQNSPQNQSFYGVQLDLSLTRDGYKEYYSVTLNSSHHKTFLKDESSGDVPALTRVGMTTFPPPIITITTTTEPITTTTTTTTTAPEAPIATTELVKQEPPSPEALAQKRVTTIVVCVLFIVVLIVLVVTIRIMVIKVRRIRQRNMKKNSTSNQEESDITQPKISTHVIILT